MIRHERIPGEGLDLHVAVVGEGPPVILLHGFPEGWRAWRHQFAPLVEAGFSVLAPDLRGYGESDRPAARRAYHLRHLVGDVEALVRWTGYPRAHVVGHDWGGIIAWTFAGEHPELLDRLAILNAPHLRLYYERVWRPPQLFRSWYVLFFLLPRLPERAIAARDFAALRRMFRRMPAQRDAFPDEEIGAYVRAFSAPGALTAALNYYREALLGRDGTARAVAARVEVETLVLWGEQDPALDLSLLCGLERVAPRVQVRRFPHSSHWLQNELPDEVNRALVEFLGPAPQAARR